MKHLKITSVLLSAVMCMSMFATPVSVLADETPADPETQTEATEKQELEATEKPDPKETKKEKPEETIKEEPEAEEKKEPEQTAEPAETEPSEENEPSETKPSESEPEAKETPEETEEPAQTEEPEEAAAPEETAPQTEENNRKAADKIILSGINTYGGCAVIYELDDKGKLTLKGEGVVPKQLFGDDTYVNQVKSIVSPAIN